MGDLISLNDRRMLRDIDYAKNLVAETEPDIYGGPLIFGCKSEEMGYPAGLSEVRAPWPDNRRIIFGPINYGMISIKTFKDGGGG